MAEMGFVGWGLPQRYGEKLSHLGGTGTGTAAPQQRTESVEAVPAPGQDATGPPSEVGGGCSWLIQLGRDLGKALRPGGRDDVSSLSWELLGIPQLELAPASSGRMDRRMDGSRVQLPVSSTRCAILPSQSRTGNSDHPDLLTWLGVPACNGAHWGDRGSFQSFPL